MSGPRRILLPLIALSLQLALLIPAGCAHRMPAAAAVGVGVAEGEGEGEAWAGAGAAAVDTVRVSCCGRADEPVTLTFLGVGGWVIRKGDVAVMTAPLFSNPDLAHAGFWTIRADPERIERHLPDVSDVTAILVGHGHYDHLMDVPYVALERAPQAIVYGNATVKHQLAPFALPPARVRVIKRDELGDLDRPGAWIVDAPGVRVMPLRSHHAPHFAGVTLFSGERTRDMEEPPALATEWLDGESVAFLIELLNRDGQVGLRVYYQDAVAAPPFGLLPPLADTLGVDVAILVPATYAEVDWHPEALLADARPRTVLLSHWEDFFRSPDSPPRPVPFTNLDGFLRRLARALPEDAGWRLPMPGTTFLLR